MCKEMRTEILRLLKDLQLSQAELVRRLNAAGTKVTAPELSNYLNGLDTPKSSAVMLESLKLLVAEQTQRRMLLDAAREI